MAASKQAGSSSSIMATHSDAAKRCVFRTRPAQRLTVWYGTCGTEKRNGKTSRQLATETRARELCEKRKKKPPSLGCWLVAHGQAARSQGRTEEPPGTENPAETIGRYFGEQSWEVPGAAPPARREVRKSGVRYMARLRVEVPAGEVQSTSSTFSIS